MVFGNTFNGSQPLPKHVNMKTIYPNALFFALVYKNNRVILLIINVDNCKEMISMKPDIHIYAYKTIINVVPRSLAFR